MLILFVVTLFSTFLMNTPTVSVSFLQHINAVCFAIISILFLLFSSLILIQSQLCNFSSLGIWLIVFCFHYHYSFAFIPGVKTGASLHQDVQAVWGRRYTGIRSLGKGI